LAAIDFAARSRTATDRSKRIAALAGTLPRSGSSKIGCFPPAAGIAEEGAKRQTDHARGGVPN
jgi:hypothetical protein